MDRRERGAGRFRRWAARLAVVGAAAAFFAAPAGAASAATHGTSYFSGGLRTQTSEPCLGGAWVELRMDWWGSIRWTDWDDDGWADQLKLDLAADVDMRSLDSKTPSYSGRLGAHLSRVTSGKSYSETFVIHSSLRGDDRSRLNIGTVVHVTSDAWGNVQAWFERPRC